MDAKARGYWFDASTERLTVPLWKNYHYLRAYWYGIPSKIKSMLVGDYEECHFHIGVHKTATTYLQEQLSLGNLDRCGVKYYPLKMLRDRIYRYGFASVGRRVSGHNRLILSDENVLNGTEYLHQGVYSDSCERIGWYIAQIKAKKLVVYINIRNFADFYTSAYCEHLRHFPYQSFSAYLADIDLSSLSWVDVFGPLIKAHPNIEFRVFNFDTFRQDKKCLLSSISFGLLNDYSSKIKASRSSFTEREVAQLSGNSQWIATSEESKYAPLDQSVVEQAKRAVVDDMQCLNTFRNVTLLNPIW
ncbi:hypothetical protein RCJ22_13670 [Vibrio sp. FNV 38]|nr:hypothetical protein [Vibrio sp. FNV 38]